MDSVIYLLQIGVVIEDKEFLESSMNGQPWKAGKFAYSLRCSLWSEHLGLHAGEVFFACFFSLLTESRKNLKSLPLDTNSGSFFSIIFL